MRTCVLRISYILKKTKAMSTIKSKPECCPEFDPGPWDDRIFIWDKKKFIQDKVLTLFFMPLNFGGVMKKLDRLISKAEATIPGWMCLSDHTSRWNMDIYLAVDKKIDGVRNTTLSGKFYSRVYEGSFKDTGKWCDDFNEKSIAQGFQIKKLYMWYTTCPKCARKYGKNYVVIIGLVD